MSTNSSKLRCSECLIELAGPCDLFSHLKNAHGLCGDGEFKCNLCLADFEKFGSFKIHTKTCFSKKRKIAQTDEEFNTTEQINQAFDLYNDWRMEYSDEISDFKEQVQKFALDLVLELSANMSIPRSLVFATLDKFQTFISKTFIHGVKTIIGPRVGLEGSSTLKRFIKTIQTPFADFDTETKLDTLLEKRGLMEPVINCELENDPIEDPLDDPYDDSEIEDDMELTSEEGSMTLMPISFMLKKFLELPKVFEKVQAHTDSIIREGKLNHFINGKLWKKKLESFNEGQIVIPYFLYVDGAQVNNPLGPHCSDGLLDFNYITLPTIPFEYQSRLENILVASISPDKSHFGVECQFNYVVEELVKLYTEGIELVINGESQRVFFVCGCFIGDNKESNAYLGFVRVFVAHFFCRYCRMHKSETQEALVEITEKLRDRQNYYEDVLKKNISETGVVEYSILNYIPLFHATESSGEDNTHIVEEGILHYNLLPSLRYFVYEKNYFTLEQFNDRVKLFDYTEDEKKNVPMPISKENLNLPRKKNTNQQTKKKEKKKFKMTASEMCNFSHNLIFMIGDLVPKDDIVWQFVLKTVKFIDLSYLPCYDEERDINELRETIASMHNSYQQLFNQKLKPIHHIATHYPTATLDFGPLRYLRTIRCEGKHKPMKNYTKNTSNRINICYSIGKKNQYAFAQRLLRSKGFEDEITTKIRETSPIESKIYFRKLEASAYKESLQQQSCSYTNKVVVNGITFKFGLWLPVVPDSGNHKVCHIMEICDIIMTKDELYVVCKTFSTAAYADMNLYSVDMSSVENNYSIINIRQYLLNHQYPVKIHKMGEEFMFRCKRF